MISCGGNHLEYEKKSQRSFKNENIFRDLFLGLYCRLCAMSCVLCLILLHEDLCTCFVKFFKGFGGGSSNFILLTNSYYNDYEE